jgi:hypothetical protein
MGTSRSWQWRLALHLLQLRPRIAPRESERSYRVRFANAPGRLRRRGPRSPPILHAEAKKKGRALRARNMSARPQDACFNWHRTVSPTSTISPRFSPPRGIPINPQEDGQPPPLYLAMFLAMFPPQDQARISHWFTRRAPQTRCGLRGESFIFTQGTASKMPGRTRAHFEKIMESSGDNRPFSFG